MAAADAKLAFAKRLRAVLEKAGIDPGKPAAVAREFNRRYMGKPMSTHGVRKWLVGESIPEQGKLVVLAQWLCVSPERLRFGPTDPTPATQLQEAIAAFQSDELDFFQSYRKLNPVHQLVLREVAQALLRVQMRDGR